MLLCLSPNDYPSLCQHRLGHSLGEEIKYMGFRIYKLQQTLKHFAGTFNQA